MKESIQLVDINPAPNAGAAGTTILTLPVGRIHGIEIGASVAAAKLAAGFRDIRFMVGGNQQRVGTFDELGNDYSLYGADFGLLNNINGGPGQLLYMFNEAFRKQYTAAERFAFDNFGDDNGNPIRDAQLEIDFLNTGAAKSLNFRAIVEPLAEVTDKQVHNAFVKHFRKSYVIGDDELWIKDLLKKDIYQRIDLYDPTGGQGAIDEVKVLINNKLRFHRTKAEQDRDLKRWGMNPQEGIFSIVPDFMDNTEDGWDMTNGKVKDFEIWVHCDAASTGNVKVRTHRFGLPE